MNFQKVISIKALKKTNFLLSSCQPLTKVSQWNGSADPDHDPYQNATDLRHCFLESINCKRSLDIIRYVCLVRSRESICIAFHYTRIVINKGTVSRDFVC